MSEGRGAKAKFSSAKQKTSATNTSLDIAIKRKMGVVMQGGKWVSLL